MHTYIYREIYTEIMIIYIYIYTHKKRLLQEAASTLDHTPQ